MKKEFKKVEKQFDKEFKTFMQKVEVYSEYKKTPQTNLAKAIEKADRMIDEIIYMAREITEKYKKYREK